MILMDLESPEALDLLVQLSEIYLGEDGEGDLLYALASGGERVRNELVLLRRRDVSCTVAHDLLPKERSRICLTRAQRDSRIDRVAKLFAEGRVPTYIP